MRPTPAQENYYRDWMARQEMLLRWDQEYERQRNKTLRQMVQERDGKPPVRSNYTRKPSWAVSTEYYDPFEDRKATHTIGRWMPVSETVCRNEWEMAILLNIDDVCKLSLK